MEYQGNFNHSAKKIYELIELLMQAREITSRVYAYAHMKKDQDTLQQKNQALFNKAQNISNKLANASSFIKPELLELSQKK